MTLAVILAPVGHAHGDFIRVRDHVRVGKDVAVGADDEARAFTLALRDVEAASRRPGRARECRSGGRIPRTGSSASSPALPHCAARGAPSRRPRRSRPRADLLDERCEVRQYAAIQRADGLRRRDAGCRGGGRGGRSCRHGLRRRREDLGEQAPTAKATSSDTCEASRNE